MGRIEEAKQILINKSAPSIGIAALGVSTYDIDQVVKGYRELYENQQFDDSLASEEVNVEKAIHGIVLWQIYQDHTEKDKVESFLSEIYPNLIAYQLFIYDHWCSADSGLIVENNELDPLINSLFAGSNESLIELGYALGLSSHDLFEKNELTLHSMNELLWSETAGLYHGYDVKDKSQIVNQRSSGFMPMIAGVSAIDQVLVMMHRAFGDDFRQAEHYSFPSYNLNLGDFDYTIPNQGAISITTNWFIIQGLLKYDMEDLADIVQEDTLLLLERYGFYEYFDPRKTLNSNGLKGDQSPAAAAIFLHLLREDF